MGLILESELKLGMQSPLKLTCHMTVNLYNVMYVRGGSNISQYIHGFEIKGPFGWWLVYNVHISVGICLSAYAVPVCVFAYINLALFPPPPPPPPPPP